MKLQLHDVIGGAGRIAWQCVEIGKGSKFIGSLYDIIFKLPQNKNVIDYKFLDKSMNHYYCNHCNQTLVLPICNK